MIQFKFSLKKKMVLLRFSVACVTCCYVV